MGIKTIEFTVDEFGEWLKDRGYQNLMGEENFEIFLSQGLAFMLFTSSNLLMSFIFNKLGLPSERLNERIRLEVGKRVKEIFADGSNFRIVLDV
ncbi:hypothetical protein Asulf_01970 [Archaeoglobus sulfaticallidus PM70-1]|uniref:Uncharacterized protein n=1 Tax=Archaeoglobus sulfaticallidus PM70-1 TaxID=387631 RepID=N0BMU4_9EURY|nr:hypothetical protein [Archaeoglobus sulfaticallidus]AGK61936.1 hypothetical protein Asulf_01970 [Archaeoglobus sulfaticallidus PM70-1]